MSKSLERSVSGELEKRKKERKEKEKKLEGNWKSKESNVSNLKLNEIYADIRYVIEWTEN